MSRGDMFSKLQTARKGQMHEQMHDGLARDSRIKNNTIPPDEPQRTHPSRFRNQKTTKCASVFRRNKGIETGQTYSAEGIEAAFGDVDQSHDHHEPRAHKRPTSVSREPIEISGARDRDPDHLGDDGGHGDQQRSRKTIGGGGPARQIVAAIGFFFS
ncbi:hypothetical protein NL676_001014 [Syzygium grande]|nr:hypothetical protein NL676_001014 [Syzygium grande]